jgi:hypothetical protein
MAQSLNFYERLCLFYERGEHMKGYLKISEVSEKWGIKERRINTLCLEGRIEGAIKFGNTWTIPEDAEKPKDERIKSGKYIKTPNEEIFKEA